MQQTNVGNGNLDQEELDNYFTNSRQSSLHQEVGTADYEMLSHSYPSVCNLPVLRNQVAPHDTVLPPYDEMSCYSRDQLPSLAYHPLYHPYPTILPSNSTTCSLQNKLVLNTMTPNSRNLFPTETLNLSMMGCEAEVHPVPAPNYSLTHCEDSKDNHFSQINQLVEADQRSDEQKSYGLHYKEDEIPHEINHSKEQITPNSVSKRDKRRREKNHQQEESRKKDSFDSKVETVKKRTSSYIGCHWHNGAGKWVAQISVHCKRTHLGYFLTEIEAAQRYDEEARKLGRTINFPEDIGLHDTKVSEDREVSTTDERVGKKFEKVLGLIPKEVQRDDYLDDAFIPPSSDTPPLQDPFDDRSPTRGPRKNKRSFLDASPSQVRLSVPYTMPQQYGDDPADEKKYVDTTRVHHPSHHQFHLYSRDPIPPPPEMQPNSRNYQNQYHQPHQHVSKRGDDLYDSELFLTPDGGVPPLGMPYDPRHDAPPYPPNMRTFATRQNHASSMIPMTYDITQLEERGCQHMASAYTHHLGLLKEKVDEMTHVLTGKATYGVSHHYSQSKVRGQVTSV